MKKQFESRTKLSVYVEEGDLALMTAKSRAEGKLLSEWARETLLGELGDKSVLSHGAVSEVKNTKTCPHGIEKDWRCTLCGGIVK